MFFKKKLNLLQKNILPQIIKPLIISGIAIFIAFLGYVIFAQRILFIYDPYTMRISNSDTSQIKRAGLRHQLFIKPIEATHENFYEIYENLSDKEKEKKLVITAYLYSMFKDNKDYRNFLDNSRLYIYGPFFDYEQSEYPINVSISVSNKRKVKRFFKKFEKLVFFIPESIYEKADTIEPESTLIAELIENFHSQDDNNVKKLPLGEEMGKNPELFEKGAINVICIRSLSPGARSLITESGGQVLFFDYFNSRNLRQSFHISTETAFSASLRYDYEKTLDKIFKNMRKNSEKKISYIATFSLSQ